jgi:hypothetical protein
MDFSQIISEANTDENNIMLIKKLFYYPVSDLPGSDGDSLMRYFQTIFMEECLKSLKDKYDQIRPYIQGSVSTASISNIDFFNKINQEVIPFVEKFNAYKNIREIIQKSTFEEFLKYLTGFFDYASKSNIRTMPKFLKGRVRMFKKTFAPSLSMNGVMRNEDLTKLLESGKNHRISYRNPDIYSGINNFDSLLLPSLPFVAGPSTHAYKYAKSERRYLRHNLKEQTLLRDLFYLVYIHFGYHSFNEIDFGFKSELKDSSSHYRPDIEIFKIDDYISECRIAVKKTFDKLTYLSESHLLLNHNIPVNALIKLVDTGVSINRFEAFIDVNKNINIFANPVNRRTRALFSLLRELKTLQNQEKTFLSKKEAKNYLKSIIGISLIPSRFNGKLPFRKGETRETGKMLKYLNSSHEYTKILNALILETNQKNKSEEKVTTYQDLLNFSYDKNLAKLPRTQQLHTHLSLNRQPELHTHLSLNRQPVSTDVLSRRPSITNVTDINNVFSHDSVYNAGSSNHCFINNETIVYRGDTRTPSEILESGGFKSPFHSSCNPYDLSRNMQQYFFGGVTGNIGVSTSLFEHIATSYITPKFPGQKIGGYLYQIILEPANLAIPNASRGIGEVNCARTIYAYQINAVCMIFKKDNKEMSTGFIELNIDQNQIHLPGYLENIFNKVENELNFKYMSEEITCISYDELLSNIDQVDSVQIRY